MQINGKDININDLLTEVDADIDKNIPKKIKNNLVLRDSQIEILKKYKIIITKKEISMKKYKH